ncbi:MAG: hypothetical protein KF833_04225 [Verrucomicrobiae bacterium]|nr:hypothetical protein [Verrucomicrobiae bacterium]
MWNTTDYLQVGPNAILESHQMPDVRLCNDGSEKPPGVMSRQQVIDAIAPHFREAVVPTPANLVIEEEALQPSVKCNRIQRGSERDCAQYGDKA